MGPDSVPRREPEVCTRSVLRRSGETPTSRQELSRPVTETATHFTQKGRTFSTTGDHHLDETLSFMRVDRTMGPCPKRICVQRGGQSYRFASTTRPRSFGGSLYDFESPPIFLIWRLQGPMSGTTVGPPWEDSRSPFGTSPLRLSPLWGR